jgi:hypothetical protein
MSERRLVEYAYPLGTLVTAPAALAGRVVGHPGPYSVVVRRRSDAVACSATSITEATPPSAAMSRVMRQILEEKEA